MTDIADTERAKAARRVLDHAHDLRMQARDVLDHADAVLAGARTGDVVTPISVAILRGMTVAVGLAVDALDPALAVRPRLVYVAGSYRAPTAWGVEQNIRRAAEVAARIWAAGLVAVCPHLNSAHMEGVATDAQFLAGTLEMLRRCDAVILVPGWELSAGSRAEVNEADRLGLPVFGLTKHTSEGSDINSLEWGLTEMNRWVVDGSLPHGEVLPYALGGD